MPTYTAPGVYVEERISGARPIAGVSTSTAAFVGVAERGPVGQATLITGFAEFVKRFGGPISISPGAIEHYLYYQVRHFFELGGTRCYVVRVVHYTNVNDPLSSEADPADLGFAAQELDATLVANALNVRALTPGNWGRTVHVAVSSTSRFQLPLAEGIVAGNFTSILLPPNTDVVPGTLLYLVHEITGVVSSVDTAARTVAFTEDLLEGGAPSAATLTAAPATTQAFKPDFSLMTTTDLAAAVDLSVTNPPAAAAVRLASVTGLGPGDAIHFVVEHALVVVLAVEAAMLSGNPVMRAVIDLTGAGIALPDLPVAETRVYARDFALQVRLGSPTGDVVETHSNLSLVAEHAADYVNTRLGMDSGASQYIVATDNPASADDIVMQNTANPLSLAGAPSDGLTDLSVTDFVGSDLAKNGLHALDAVDDASILVIGYSRLTPTATPNPLTNQQNLTSLAIAWVGNRRDMFYVIDPPPTAGTTPVTAVQTFRNLFSSDYSGIYFPWIQVADQLTGLRLIAPPSGAVAGVFARSDGRRGVHKAPAGFDVGILSVATGLGHQVTPGENDILYPRSINAIRNFSEGIVVWGSRTIAADPLWQQVNVRRLFIFLERSIQLGTQWVVFEPNDRTLWKTIERSVKGFLRIQWIEGKLVGATEDEAFFVRCNEETNPLEVVDAGMVITEIGVSPSRPAEFVVFRIFQFAGRES